MQPYSDNRKNLSKQGDKMARAAGVKNVIMSFLDKLAPKKSQVKVTAGKDKVKDSPFADKINEDKLNKPIKKTKIKGQKKFLEDVRIYTMFHMISLFWSQRIVGSFLRKAPNPVEYGTMPTIMRRINREKLVEKMSHQVVHNGSPSYTYGLTKAQVKSVVKKEIIHNPTEYKTFK